ncbi:hypothetical protein NDI48_26945 [Microcoleus sp. AS-A8]
MQCLTPGLGDRRSLCGFQGSEDLVVLLLRSPEIVQLVSGSHRDSASRIPWSKSLLIAHRHQSGTECSSATQQAKHSKSRTSKGSASHQQPTHWNAE